MKRTILASIIGIAAAMAVNSAHAQGKVILDNYAGSGNAVVYGGGGSAMAGTTAGNPIKNGVNGSVGTISWTVGVYTALGDTTGSVASDPTGVADPSTLGGGLTLNALTATINQPGGTATGAGFFSGGTISISGYTSGLATFEVVAYSGSSYDASAYRGHSGAFTLTPSTGNNTPPDISSLSGGMPTFSVFTAAPTPEPSILALSGIGAAALMLFRRKK